MTPTRFILGVEKDGVTVSHFEGGTRVVTPVANEGELLAFLVEKADAAGVALGDLDFFAGSSFHFAHEVTNNPETLALVARLNS